MNDRDKNFSPDEELNQIELLNRSQQQQQAREDLAQQVEEKRPEENKRSDSPQLDREFGYVNADYYLDGAEGVYGDWAKDFTPAGLANFAESGADLQYQEALRKGDSETLEQIEKAYEEHQRKEELEVIDRVKDAEDSSDIQWQNLSPSERETLGRVLRSTDEQGLSELPLRERLEAIKAQHLEPQEQTQSPARERLQSIRKQQGITSEPQQEKQQQRERDR
jgi:hypothetical protein